MDTTKHKYIDWHFNLKPEFLTFPRNFDIWARGTGIIGRAVASDIRAFRSYADVRIRTADLWCPQATALPTVPQPLLHNRENKEKEAGMGPLKKVPLCLQDVT